MAPPDVDGQWEAPRTTPGDSRTTGDGLGVFTVHAALLRTGRILWFSGHVETAHYLAESWVWDPEQPTSTAVKQAFPADHDIFCCHMVSLEDGRVLTLGGSRAHPNHGSGIKAVNVFDPSTLTWQFLGDMHEARWYPTAVVLPDGRVVVFSGRTEDASVIAETAEVLGPPGYAAETVTSGDRLFSTYPGMHLVPGGRIFHTATNWRYEAPAVGTVSFRMAGRTSGAWDEHGGLTPHVDDREEGTSVLLPPAQDGRILLLGGARAMFSGNNFTGLSAASEPNAAEILDPRTSPPTWTRIDDMHHPRINPHAVLLPDGTVLIAGGHDNYKWGPNTPSNQAEIYDPLANRFTAAATMAHPRTYHSTALLVPDGRVVLSGGVDPTQNEPGVGALNLKTMQFYRPPYFFKGPRPTIASIVRDDGPDDVLAYGGEFTIDTTNAADIVKVALMRPGAPTHHTDSEQRYVALEFTREAGRLRVRVPDDPSVAPPGWYMLWIVDSTNRPCTRAQFVRLSR